MSASEAIINKILLEAKAQAEAIINDAKLKAESEVSLVKDKAKEHYLNELNRVKGGLDDIVKRKLTVSNLEVRKIMLSYKQQAIDEVFNDALISLNNLSRDEYRSIIKGMLKAHANDDDTVTVSKKDKDVIDKAFIDSVASGLNIELNYNAQGDFDGGIILSSRNYDKNLTLSVQLNLLREDMEPEVNALLFGDNN